MTGAQASYINGTMEVFGKKADVIIANENGINVNGATTINANSLTLSTGKVQIKEDGNYKLAVEKGNVSLTGQGISTDGLSYFDIVSRSAKLEGEISGNADIKIVAGQNDYDLTSRSHTVRATSDRNVPDVAIDGRAMGSMYGGKIQLISTESGAGVRHEGSIIATDDIDISANGDVTLTGLRSDKNVNVSGKNIALNKNSSGVGSTEAQQDIVLRALSGLTVNNDLISRNGTIRIDASTLLQNSAAIVAKNGATTAVPAIQINVAGQYTLSGKLKALDASGGVISGGVVTLKDGDFVVMKNGQQVAFSSIVSDTEIVSNSGDVKINAGSLNNNEGVILAKRGTLQIDLNGAFENNGSISATGDIRIASGSMKNNGILYATNAQTLTVGRLDNAGRLYADNNLVMTASALNNSGRIGAGSGEVRIKSTGDMSNSGTLNGDDALVFIDADGNIVNDGTIASNRNDVTLASGGQSVSNKGRIEGLNVTARASNANATVSNSGSINAGEQLTLETANLKNQAGTLSAAKDMQLKVTKQLHNSQNGTILAGKTLTVTGSGDLALNNDNGKIQGENITATGLSSVTNTHDALLAAKENITLSATSVLNDAATIQASSLMLDRIDTVDNLNAATLYAANTLTLSSLNTLNNDGGFVISDGKLTLSDIKTVNNTQGATLFGAGDTTLKNVGTLNNSGASLIKSDTALSVASVTTLNNSSDAVIASSADLNINAVKTLNNQSVMVSNGTITIDTVDELKNEGVVQAGLDLIIRNIKDLTSTGENHVLVALRNLTMEDIESLTNGNGAIISANMNVVLNAIGILTNHTAGIIQAVEGSLDITAEILRNMGNITDEDGQQSVSAIVAGGDINIDAVHVYNNDGAAIVSTLNDLTIDAFGSVINANNAVLSGAQSTTLNVAKGNVTNENNALIAGNNVTINAGNLTNHQSGATIANNDLTLNIDSLNNTSGILEAGHDLLLKIKDSLSLDDNNSNIRAGHDMTLSTQGSLFNNTMTEAKGNLNLQADGTFVNNKSVVTGGDLHIRAKDVANNSNTLLWSLGNLEIDAREGAFVNDYTGNVMSMGDMSLIANTILNYAGIIRSEQNINIDAAYLENQSTWTGGEISQTQTQDAVGQWSGIDNVMTKASITTALHIPVLSSDIAMDKLGEISAGKDININQRGIFTEKEIKNTGGLIQAGRDITITGNLLNSPKYTAESMYDYLNLTLEDPIVLTDFWKVAIDHYTTLTFTSLYQYFNFIFGDGQPETKTGKEDPNRERSYKSLLDASNSSTQLSYVMSKVFGETWNAQEFSTLSTAWRSLTESSYNPLRQNMIYFVPAEKGEITAGRDFIHNGGTLDNGLAYAGIIKENATIQNIDVGDYSVDTVIAGYDVDMNTKTVEELAMGISPLPTIKDLVSLPGMFEVTNEFKKASAAEKNGTEYHGPSNNIIPIFETRPEMIDQSQYSGSDYYFDQVDYTATEPVNVIGDNYFISELIRREISHSVGSIFAVRDGLEGDALVQNLMDNAGVAAKDSNLNLVVGQPLSEEQREGLTQDIVWFVSQNIKGTEVLVPVVYLCPETLHQIESGDVTKGTAAIAAGNSLSVDATAINNVNGTLTTQGDMSLVAQGDIKNISNATDAGINAGGNISMTTVSGNIASNGAAINAGGNVDMAAENGDITLTASVGHGEDGKQVIHAHDDGVTAGGTVNMQAKTITSNAADITAGQDVNMKATEGDVTFNDLHQIEKAQNGQAINAGTTTAEVLGDVSNVLLNDLAGASITVGGTSTKTTETTTKTAENISSINAGNVSINSSEDTTLNGVNINSSTTTINAGGDVSMNAAKTTTETTTSSTQHKGGVTVGAGVSLSGGSSGVSVDYSGNKEHGSSSSTSHRNTIINGDNVNVNAGGDLNMNGANVAAHTADVNVAGDMNVVSQQDTEHTGSSRTNWGASVGIAVSGAGVVPTVAGNGGGGSESYDSAKTTTQSGINTTGEMNVKTGGDLNMTGANLVSQDGTGSVAVAGDINAKTLEDRVEQDGIYGGAGLGFGGTPGQSAGIPSANLYVDTVDEIHYNETQKSTIAVGETTSAGVNGDVNSNKDEMSVVTRDEKEAGNNISYTLADPGIRKKKKADADIDTDTPSVPDEVPSGGGCPHTCIPVKPGSSSQTTIKNTTNNSQHATTSTTVKTTETINATAASSSLRADSVATNTVRSEAVPAVTPSQAQPLTPKESTPAAKKTPATATPVKKWAVPDTHYPVLSPGSSTAKTGKDMPKTPEHKQWNGEMTNGVAPSSDAKGSDVKLSPGSSTGQTGMDMPKTPEHKKWNGDMSKGAMNARPQWKPLQVDRPINIYASVTITFTDQQYS